MALINKKGVWIVDYYPQGRAGPRKRIRLPKDISETDARQIEKDLRGLRKSQDKPTRPKEGRTVSELLAEYISWYEIHRRPSTVKDFQDTKTRLDKILGGEIAENVSLDHITLYKRMRLAEAGRKIHRAINKELS